MMMVFGGIGVSVMFKCNGHLTGTFEQRKTTAPVECNNQTKQTRYSGAAVALSCLIILFDPRKRLSRCLEIMFLSVCGQEPF
jgi:hypothetical protein